MARTTVSPEAREDLARLINDSHQCTRLWSELRQNDPAWTRSHGDDYAINTAYKAADALIEAGWRPSPGGEIVTGRNEPDFLKTDLLPGQVPLKSFPRIANPVAEDLRGKARILDNEANRYGGDRTDPIAAEYRRAADEIDRLTDGWARAMDELNLALRDREQTPESKPAEKVELYGGPFHGATPTLSRQPVRLVLAARYTYVRVNDPDTGESLNFYAYLEGEDRG